MNIVTQLSSLKFRNSNINVLYYNDMHGSTKNLSAFTEAQDDFYHQNEAGTNYTLCGGDAFLDVNNTNHKVAETIAPRTDAFGPGNHDLDGGNYLSTLIDKFKMANKWVAANLVYTKPTPLEDDIKKSVIINKGKEKIGVIGLAPLDIEKVLFKNKNNNFIKAKPLNETIEGVKQEVAKLEKRGINKIFLLAHTGEKADDGTNYYKTFAGIGGIDVVIGGHDHIEVNDWEQSDRGEPVKIVATGRSNEHDFGENLDYIGQLNLEFDDKGILVQNKCKNNFKNISKSEEIQQDNIDLTPVSHVSKPVMKGNPLIGHSEIGNLVADSNLWYVNKHTTGEKADFAFVNAGTMRGNIDSTSVTMNDIENIVPFTSPNLIKTPLSKKNIIGILNWCALSSTFPKISPGMMQVSGMEYTVQPDLTVSDVHILNKDGSVKYNLDEYDDDDKFNAVYDTFLATAPAGMKDLEKDCENDKNIEFFDANRQSALYDYLTQCADRYDYEKVRINTKSLVSARD